MNARRYVRAAGACGLLLVSVSLPAMASAQLAGEVAAPERALVDDNGVNVASGQYRSPRTDLVVGSGPGEIRDSRIYGRQTWKDARISLYNPFSPSGPVTVGTGNKTYSFARSASGFAPASDGARLVVTGGIYQIILPDGTKYSYGQIEKASRHADSREYDYDAYAYLSSIEYPSGLKVTLEWLTSSYCAYGGQYVDEGIYNCRLSAPTNSGPPPQIWLTRLNAISNSAGYRIDYQFAGSFLGGGRRAPTAAEISSWSQLTGGKGGNALGGAGTLPSATYVYATTPLSGGGYVSTDDVTDGLGRTTRYTKQFGSTNYEAVRRPGSGGDNVRVNMDANLRVSSIVQDGATWTYAFAMPTATTSTLTVTDPAGRTHTYQSDLSVGLPTRIEDEYGRVTSYTYDSANRLKTGTSPGGQVTTYDYDDRSNVTRTTVTAPGGATLSSSATYQDYSCTTAGTCNRMATNTDARGVVTTYGYDPTHGGVTSAVTQNPGGTNPSIQTRYAQVAGVWMVASIWSCRTQATCENGADAVRTTTQYNANLLPASVTTGSGDGSVQAVTTTTYTAAGDVLTVDGPLSGTDDTTRYYYDAARQRLGAVGPDPDGSGQLLRRALRVGYDGWGRATSIAQGTAADQGDPALAGITVLQTRTATLDDAGRVRSEALTGGSTTFSRTDYAYDAVGRPTCTAQRMNPNALGAAADACTVGGDAGFGPDRVTFVQYSAAGAGNPASTSVTTGYGTAAAATETVLQTATGKPASATDGNGNVTAYAYDGFDRPWRTCFQTASSAACGGAPADFEQVGYDAKGDATSKRLRDGQSIGYQYDTLGRMTNDGQGHSFAYDLLGSLTSANDSNNAFKNFAWDALGRKTSESAAQGGATTIQYDAAGRRTRLTWADGFFVTYEYDMLGEMTAIRENGATVLAGFGYDDLGRRASLARANGTSTSYAYDAGSRLTGLSLNGGPANSYTFGYNPAGQIATRTSSNDAFAWTGATNVDRSYGVNGLNQYTQSGPVVPTYDGRGNLTSAGSATYGYNLQNQLTTFTGGYIYRNALGQWLDVNTEQRWMVYDDDRTIEEFGYDGTVKRRYVYGPGEDEPLVWYEGAGTADRRFLHADERGSIVAVSDSAGGTVAINSYDEFGIPGTGNVGRFQYTGQRWISALGLYDYKARMYSPTLGRFLQTDPVGYADGVNWYNYVGSDPVNATDPTGLYDDGECLKNSPVHFDATTGSLVPNNPNDIVVCGKRLPNLFNPFPFGYNYGGGGSGGTPDRNYGGGTGTPPQSVTVDPSCAGIPAVANPAVQKAALNALAQARQAKTEFGFFATRNVRGSPGYTAHPAFTSGIDRKILGADIVANTPGSISVYDLSPVYVHTHQNNPPPSPAGTQDGISAGAQGLPVVAIDRAGTMTCKRP